MRRILARTAAILGVLLLPAAGAQEVRAPSGTDLARIDRTLLREPAYQSDAAQYCLLVFGAKAKTRVWLALDGDTLYVDRNANGDLTDPGEAVAAQGSSFDVGALTEPDGTRHPSLRLRRMGDSVRLWARIHGLGVHYVGYEPGEPLHLAYRPEEAPVVHLGGPLTMRFYVKAPKLVAGKTSDLNLMVGTEGLGRGTFSALRCNTVLDAGAVPVADIAFPHRDPRRGPILVRVSVGDD